MEERGFVKKSLTFVKRKLREYARVYKITKKPSNEEYKATVRASGLGMLLIGLIGFLIALLAQTLRGV